MLPRIKIDDSEWQIADHIIKDVKFYQTDHQLGYDDDFRCRSGEKHFYTLSFTLEITALDIESIYIAYDRPYNYTQDL